MMVGLSWIPNIGLSATPDKLTNQKITINRIEFQVDLFHRKHKSQRLFSRMESHDRRKVCERRPSRESHRRSESSLSEFV